MYKNRPQKNLHHKASAAAGQKSPQQFIGHINLSELSHLSGATTMSRDRKGEEEKKEEQGVSGLPAGPAIDARVVKISFTVNL